VVILEATGPELRTLLLTCLAVPRWAEEVAAGAPHATADALLEQARRAATPLSLAEIDQALAEHPRIGQSAQGDGRAAAFSRREQQAPDAGDTELAAALAAGNAAYEARFGRVFLIRAAGRTRAEILTELRRRLALDGEVELAVVGRELREIALLRLRQLLAEDEHGQEAASDGAVGVARSRITTHVLDTTRGAPATGLEVTLERRVSGTDTHWEVIARGRTDEDGRISTLGPAVLPAGRYRVTFDTGGYLTASRLPVFYPEVAVTIELADPAAHYHVPLLLNPFGYSTYRGS
jgi:hydroxyisourate hydrolase